MANRHYAAIVASADSKPAIIDLVYDLHRACREVQNEADLERDPAIQVLVLALAQRTRAFLLQDFSYHAETMKLLESRLTIEAPHAR